jgi:serine/threonine protein phosphatase PrpC
MSYRWWSCCRTSTGRRRRINEDAYLALHDIGLWLIADGMGGHARGDVASHIVVESFSGLDKPYSMEAFVQQVRDRLQQANRRISEEVLKAGSDQVMGSTVVAFLVFKREWRCLWAGDSRAYLMRNGQLTQITQDHSIAQEMVEKGQLQPEEAESHPLANRITRAVGTQHELVLDEYRAFLRDGDAFLLCSDGLNKEVNEQELATILENFDCEEASRELVDLSLERGARDNVTVAVIRFEATTGFGDQLPDTTDFNHALANRRLETVTHRRAGAEQV